MPHRPRRALRIHAAALLLGALPLAAPAGAAGWRSAGSMSGAKYCMSATLLPTGKILIAGGHPGPLTTAELYDPFTQTVTATGSLKAARGCHSATLLKNGKVLIVGGGPASAELYDWSTGQFSFTAGAPAATRNGQSATLLADGKVLLVAGDATQASAELYDPASDSFSATTGGLVSPRSAFTATLLSDGRVLIAAGANGGTGTLNAELYDPATKAFSAIGSPMHFARTTLTATLLADGRVLLAGGGRPSDGAWLNVVEIFNPAGAGSFSDAATMLTQRRNHTAVLLPNGKALVATGNTGPGTNTSTSEIYDPATNTWSSAGSLASGRHNQAGILLPGGKLLIFGGWNGFNAAFASIEAFEPGMGSWAAVASMNTARNGHTATLLPDGRVLVAGAFTPCVRTGASEIFDPVANTWTNTGSMGTGRLWHVAVLLHNGRVLAAGGISSCGGYTTAADLYDPVTGTWSPTGSMASQRGDFPAALLNDGRVLVSGAGPAGSVIAGAEIYDPDAGSWSSAGNMQVARAGHTFTLLSDGRVLAVSGSNLSGYSATAEIFNPGGNTWTLVAAPAQARANHAAVLLPNGKVLVTGGDVPAGGNPASAELYDPAANLWSSAGSMSTSRTHPNATLLPNGKVLIASGDNASGTTTTTDIYDPGSNSWSAGPTLAAGHGDTPAVLLQDGRVLIPGGYNASGTITGAEAVFWTEFDYRSMSPAIQPVISQVNAYTSFPASARPGLVMTIGGSRLIAAAQEISGNASQAGNGNLPRVFLRPSDSATGYKSPNLGNYWIELTSAAQATPATATSITVTLPATIRKGYYQLSVMSNGVPSDSKTLLVSPTAPLPPAPPAVQAPTAVLFDDVSSSAVTASAYVATPGFSALDAGQSGINITTGSLYGAWHSPGNRWSSRQPMPSLKTNHGAAVVKGRLFAFGGDGGNTTTLEYNPVTDSWATRAAMITGRVFMGVAVVNGKIYAMGGCCPVTNANEMYDPATDTWSSKAPMPTARTHLAAAAVNGKIYAMGGYNGSPMATNEEYDPSADSWISKAVLLQARYGPGAAAAGGKAFLIGGYNGGALNRTDAFDPGNNTWTAKAAMPTARSFLTIAALGAKFFALGGDPGGATAQKNEEYDPANDVWTSRADLPAARNRFPAAAALGRIYAVGGDVLPSTQNDEYDPGVASRFTGLSPNTLYAFKAKARDAAGTETAESPVFSTYTLATVGPASGPTFTAVSASAVTVQWSSGSAAQGFNGPGASYLLQASLSPGFSSIAASSATVGTSATLGSLTPSTLYYLRVRATNNAGVSGDFLSLGSVTTTVLDATPPTVSAFGSLNSAGALLTESQVNDLLSGVTAQVTVQDLQSGLATNVPTRFCGQDAANANRSCKAIKDACKSTADGYYWLDPRGLGAASAFQAYCDMSGGGWTLVVRANNTGDNALNTTAAYNGPVTPTGASAKISHADIQALSDGALVNNPIKLDFADIGVSRYVWKSCSWTSATNRNKCASWAATTDAATHLTRCGNPESPDLNNGNGGEWASNAIPWPYQDGTCALNGGFSTTANGCVAGNGDSFCSPSNWSAQTGIATTGRYKLNIWVLGAAGVPGAGSSFSAMYTTSGGSSWVSVTSTVPTSAPYLVLSGANGSTAPETLKVLNLNLAPTANNSLCGGVAPCAATNQLKFTVADLAGNQATAGPFAIQAKIPEVIQSTVTVAGSPELVFTAPVTPTAVLVATAGTTGTVVLASAKGKGISLISNLYDLGPDHTTFSPPAVITLAYDPAALGNVNPNTLAIYDYDTATGNWIKLGGTLDANAHTLTVTVTQLASILGVFSESPALTYVGPSGGNWNDPANWSPAQIPVSGSEVTIDKDVTVSASGAAIEFKSLSLGDAAGSFAPTLVLSTTIAAGGSVVVYNRASLEQGTSQALALGGDLTLHAGATLRHSANTSATAASGPLYRVHLQVAGTLDLKAGAAIAVSGRGYPAGAGPGFGGVCGFRGEGGGHGGLGGNYPSCVNGYRGPDYDSLSAPVDLGSGGGSGLETGGSGGGAVILSAQTLLLNGSISADGSPGAASPSFGGLYGGGGAGGSININAVNLSGGGSLSAAGGNNGGGGGSGAGGRIAITATGSDGFTGSHSAAGAGGAPGPGGTGTIYRKGPAQAGFNLFLISPTAPGSGANTPIHGASLGIDTFSVANAYPVFDPNSQVSASSVSVNGSWTLLPTTFSYGSLSVTGDLTLAAGATLVQGSTLPARIAGNLTLTTGSRLRHSANGAATAAPAFAVNLSVGGTLDLQAGASIDGVGKGFRGGNQSVLQSGNFSGFGPGAGNVTTCANLWGAGAASHGGLGGSCPGGAGPAYDLMADPRTPGSGGAGATWARGGNGGGAVILSAGGRAVLNGTIDVTGSGGERNDFFSGGSGGSGGSISISAGAVTGSGTLKAEGGAGVNSVGSGGGGGGRIAVRVSGEAAPSDLSQLTFSALGGTAQLQAAGAQHGGAGTVYLKGFGQANFDLRIGGAAPAGHRAITPVSEALVVDNLTVSGAAVQSTGTLQPVTVLNALTLTPPYGLTLSTLTFPTAGLTSFTIPAGSTISVSSMSYDPQWDWSVGGLSIDTLTARSLEMTGGGVSVGALTLTGTGGLTVPAGVTASFGSLKAPSVSALQVSGTLNAPTAELAPGAFALAPTGAATLASLALGSSLSLPGGARLTLSTLGVTGDLLLASGAALSHAAPSPSGLYVSVNGNATLAANSLIDGFGKGYLGGNQSGARSGGLPGAGPGGGGASPWSAGGGGHGGRGGNGFDPWSPGQGGPPYDDPLSPARSGSGGGGQDWTRGGNGGGAVALIVSGAAVLDGTIDVRGEGGSSNSSCSPICHTGGGSGGAIRIRAGSVAGTGALRADGGLGPGHSGQGRGAGGGAGGRISVPPGFQGTTSVLGGAAVYSGAQAGQDGTVKVFDPDPPSLTSAQVSADGITFADAATTTLPGTTGSARISAQDSGSGLAGASARFSTDGGATWISVAAVLSAGGPNDLRTITVSGLALSHSLTRNLLAFTASDAVGNMATSTVTIKTPEQFTSATLVGGNPELVFTAPVVISAELVPTASASGTVVLASSKGKGITLISNLYDLGPEAVTFSPPAVITLAYDPAALGRISVNTLAIYDYDFATGNWIKLGGALDAANHTLTVSVTQLTSILGIYGGPFECGTVLTAAATLIADMSCPGTALVMGANGLTLDCEGHTISYGTSLSRSYGVSAAGTSNGVLRNCRIVQGGGNSFSDAVALGSGFSVTDSTITTTDGTSDGVSAGGGGNAISRNVINSGRRAVYVAPSVAGNRILGNRLTGIGPNGVVFIEQGTDTEIDGNTIFGPGVGTRGVWCAGQRTRITSNTFTTDGEGVVLAEPACANSSVLDNTIDQTGTAFVAKNGIIVNFFDNTIAGNVIRSQHPSGSGITLGLRGLAASYGMTEANTATRNLIKDNRITAATGIYLSANNSGNTLYNNRIAAASPVGQAGYTGSNIWNTTKQNGTNISGGQLLGGNYWSNPSQTGFSETCRDVDQDRICDEVFALTARDSDSLPLAAPDTTPPTVFVSSPAANAAGWYNSDVTVSFSGDDARSGIASCTPPVTLNAEGSAQSATGSCTDNAGNTTSVTVSGINIDKTPPQIAVSSPAAGTYVAQRDTIRVLFSAADILDPAPQTTAQLVRLATAAGAPGKPAGPVAVTNGQTFDPLDLAAGVWRLQVQSLDRAGNADSVPGSSFTVIHDILPPRSALAVGNPRQRDFVTSQTTFTLSAQDDLVLTGDAAGLGVASILYKVDGGAEQAFAGPFALAGEGPHTISFHALDAVGNVETVQAMTFTVDDTGPSVSASLSPAPNAAGWNRSDVTVTWSGTDAGAGLASCSASASVTTEGAAQTRQGTCTDVLGNAATGGATVNLDKTAPTVTAARTPAANAAGWNNTDVTVSFTCSDALSGTASCTGPATLGEGADQAASGTATDVAGNSASTSLGGVSVDKTAPTITAARAPQANANGWNNTDVTVSFSCSDALSGTTGCPAPVTLGDGANQSASGSVSDRAGNSASAGIGGINVNKVPPIITASRSPAANGFGWSNTPVTVSFSCSGVLGPGACPAPVVLNEGADQSASGNVTDLAGNTSSTTLSGVHVDTTAPTISLTRLPAANGDGWNNTDVTVAFSCSDALSGVAVCPSSTTLSAEGAGQSVTGTASDLADNVSAATAVPINIDRTPPVTVLNAQGGLTFRRFGRLFASPDTLFGFSVGDALAGVRSTFYSVDGGSFAVYASSFSLSAGTHTVAYYSVDKADNQEAVQARSFSVSVLMANGASVQGRSRHKDDFDADDDGRRELEEEDDDEGGSVILSGRSLFTGSIAANGTYHGKGKSVVRGDVTAARIDLDGKSVITGRRIVAAGAVARDPVDMAAALAEAQAGNNNAAIAAFLKKGVLTLKRGTLTLSTGTYLLTGIDLDERSVVTLSGPVSVFVRGKIRLEGRSRLNDGGADARELVIFSDSSKDVSLSGGARMGAVLYAPRARVKFSGNAQFGGNLYAGLLRMTGNGIAVQAGGVVPPDPTTITTVGLLVPAADGAFRLGEVYAFPNPARGSQRPTLHVESGLADAVRIHIYDLAGDLVHSDEAAGPPGIVDDGQGPQYAFEVLWNTDRVGSGVYVYVIEARKSGEAPLKKIGKVAVIK